MSPDPPRAGLLSSGHTSRPWSGQTDHTLHPRGTGLVIPGTAGKRLGADPTQQEEGPHNDLWCGGLASWPAASGSVTN